MVGKLLAVVAVGSLALAASAQARGVSWQELHRPLHLPQVTAGEGCPISPVDERVDWEPINAFGTYGTGRGPVYPVIGYPPVGELTMDRFGADWFAGKVFWYVQPSYRGRVLIRGAQLDGPSRLGFAKRHHDVAPKMKIGPGDTVQWSGQPPGSRGIPSGVAVEGSGCYGVQIDGATFSRTVVFSVRASD